MICNTSIPLHYCIYSSLRDSTSSFNKSDKNIVVAISPSLLCISILTFVLQGGFIGVLVDQQGKC